MSISNFFKKKQVEETVTDDSPIFATKEDYLAMRQAWKDYINSGKHLEDGGRLNSSHYLLYALLRDRDIYKSFKPITIERKLGGGHKFRGLIQAKGFLHNAALTTYTPYYIDILLKPFGDTVTKEMVDKMNDKMSKIKFGWY